MALHGTSGRHRIYLMRHGEVRYFDEQGKPLEPDGVLLTDHGRAQAEAAGQALANIDMDRVVCSGLPRTRQTAELVMGSRAGKIEERPALSEMRLGKISDIPRDRIEAELVYGLESAHLPGARMAGGEVFADFEARVVGGFEGLLGEPGWTTMLVVAHDGVNRALLGWACGAGLAALGSFEQDMGCVNIIDVDLADGEIVRRLIKAVNLTPYNLAKLGLNRTSMETVCEALIRRPA
jgi:phosphoserine phosphatase